MNILTIGDVVGTEAIEYIHNNLWAFRNKNNISLTIANGENASIGNGLTSSDAKALLDCGIDVLTTGNHVWQKHDLRDFMDMNENIIRPANYPGENPGSGYTVINIEGYRFLIINVMGVILMEPLADPFETVERILAREEGKYDFAILDIHAETTSEKYALARHFDGRISIIFGTHTHVTTADEQILPCGSGYITDLGMSGPQDSILGIRSDIIIRKLRTRMPVKFEIAKGNIVVNGTLFTLDTSTKKVTAIKRVQF